MYKVGSFYSVNFIISLHWIVLKSFCTHFGKKSKCLKVIRKATKDGLSRPMSSYVLKLYSLPLTPHSQLHSSTYGLVIEWNILFLIPVALLTLNLPRVTFYTWSKRWMLNLLSIPTPMSITLEYLHIHIWIMFNQNSFHLQTTNHSNWL